MARSMPPLAVRLVLIVSALLALAAAILGAVIMLNRAGCWACGW